MARKEIEITIEEGRDAGKKFKITEMPAVQADRWITRALCLLGKSKTDLSAFGVMDMGALLNTFSAIEFSETEPLLNELLACASFEKDGASVPMKGDIINSVIEDWETIFRLKVEALKIILGFLDQGGESESK